MNTVPILEFQNVSKTFSQDLFSKPKKALINASFSFENSTGTALLGHNGAGKTTCIRIMLGLLNKDEGKVLFKNKTIAREDRGFIGYMPETNKLPNELRVHELLDSSLTIYRPDLKNHEKRILVLQKLEQVGLAKKFYNTKIKHLSKGLGRRLAWALATIHSPQLLILDEPFSGMDPLAQMIFLFG
jgi:ABC-2 type transport system ATP-binding protein